MERPGLAPHIDRNSRASNWIGFLIIILLMNNIARFGVVDEWHKFKRCRDQSRPATPTAALIHDPADAVCLMGGA
jgi:hypothetical protein